MRKKLIAYSFLPILGLGVFGINFASAHGSGMWGDFRMLPPDQVASRQQAMFQEQATILGLSVDEIKNAWAEGKTMKELMEEKGITKEQVAARTKDLKLQQSKAHLQILVDKGVITQAQADKRLEAMKTHLERANGKMLKRGMGRHMGWRQ